MNERVSLAVWRSWGRVSPTIWTDTQSHACTLGF